MYTGFAHPRLVELAAGAALGVSVGVLAWALVTSRSVAGRALPVGPLAAYLVSLWSWTILSAVDPVFRYVIPALHSIQYGYFVWLLRRNEARAREGAPFFGPPARTRVATLALSAIALGWLLFHGAPGLLDAALVPHDRHGEGLNDLGATPFLAALYVIVNVHHFAMDSVLWRRENPAMRFLTADAA